MNLSQYKTMVGPIVASLVMIIGAVSGHQITKDLQDQITSYVCAAILFGTTVWGIYYNHRKDVQK